MKFSRLLLGGLLVISLSALSACNKSPEVKPPNQVIKDGLIKFSSLSRYRYEGNVSASMKEKVEPQNVHFDFRYSGGLDFTSAQDPKFNLLSDVVLHVDKDENTGSFEARMNKDAVFLNIKNFAIKNPEGTVLPKELTDQYIGKWIKFTFPENFLKEMISQLPFQNEAEKTPEQVELKKLFEQTDFLKDVRFVATEDVKGVSSSHFSGMVDRDRLYGFMLQLAEIQERTLSEDEKQSLKADLQKYDVALDLWIGKNPDVLTRASMVVTLKGSEEEPQGTLSLAMTFFDFDKEVTVEVPKEAMELPLGNDLPVPGFGMGIESDMSVSQDGLMESQEIPGN